MVQAAKMTFLFLFLPFIDGAALSAGAPGKEKTPKVHADPAAPRWFPHRIWAACDFEGQTPDYGWFGLRETNNLPSYPGNRTALAANIRPFGNTSAIMSGINPVPGPRMGKENGLFLRYYLVGGTEATFQHFSLTSEDNWHIDATELVTGKWSSATLNFTRDAQRNDRSGRRFQEGERMDDFKMFAGPPERAAKYKLSIDDVIFFANDPTLPPEPEPFPNRVIFLAGFDTGPKEKYWPGEFTIVDNPPRGADWRAAESVPRPNARGQIVSIEINPPRPVGEKTKLRFRYFAEDISELTVQLFDATVQDNRHVILRNLKPRQWTTQYVDFSRDARRNDGASDVSFPAGNLVDAIFFLAGAPAGKGAKFYIDEVVLFDAARHAGSP
jgi:hypothetical protein